MSERIEKLLEQCKVETYGIGGELLEFGFDAEKFAQLIVKECVNVVESQKESLCDDTFGCHDRNCIYEQAVDDSVDMIKEHFGIK